MIVDAKEDGNIEGLVKSADIIGRHLFEFNTRPEHLLGELEAFIALHSPRAWARQVVNRQDTRCPFLLAEEAEVPVPSAYI